MTKILASTQEHLDIEDIKDSTLVLKNGGAAMVLQTTAVNFDLLSVREQDAAIAAFSSMLNSLSFPIQIIVRSKKMDISKYIENVRKVESSQQEPKLKDQTKKYIKFVEELVTKNEALDKNFYVVIPYNTISVTPGSSPFSWIYSLLGANTKKKTHVDVGGVLNAAKVQLEPKRDHLIKEFTRMNIKARQMTTEELASLFYDIYNPGSARFQKVRQNISDYTTTLVEPKLE
ncbi:MAG: hypothetical protein ABIJ36_00505 [Patescibacteria group bacterium]|nr:hypothetical protein [Patescibacteria group bacterium]